MKLINILLVFINLHGLYAQTENKIWRPFSDDSPWNQKISDDTKTDSSSQKLIYDFASRGPIYINIKDWSIPLYFVNADTTPKYNVQDSRPGIYGKGFEFPRQIPVPKYAVPSPPENGDNHLCIIDTLKNLEWDMWLARLNPTNEWMTGLGTVINLSGTGVSEPWFSADRELDAHRARASGFPLSAGLIRVEEIKAGKIEHALVFAYDHCRSEFFIPPASTAQATKANIKNNFGIPMGGRIQLDPGWDVENSGLTESGKIIARALQKYGAYCGDFAGANVIYAENSPQAIAEWQDILHSEELYEIFTAEMIKKNFRVLDMGNILPGQNFSEKPPYFLSFKFPQQLSSAQIDYFNNHIEIVIPPEIDLKKLTAIFRSTKSTRVYLDDVEQISNKTINDFSYTRTYVLHTKDGKKKEWTIHINQ